MDKTGFIQLLDKYITHSITVEEWKQLSQLLKDPSYHTELEAIIDQQLAGNEFEVKEDEAIRELIFEKLERSRKNSNGLIRRMIWRRIAVAASIILILGIGSYFVFFNKSLKQDKIVKTIVPDDVKAPETTSAMITLANGQKIYLDSTADGALAMQGNTKLVKLANGEIAYQTASGEISKEIKFNTLENPRGSKVINMTFADGSKVWLNAGSSVTYPVVFIGRERKVTITGEAYFEVAHNTAMPFKVSQGETVITVLGTHFNMNAYDDEADIKVTLLEGKVDVNATLLKPGQQAQVDPSASSGGVNIIDNVDLDAVMAWKNGLFSFKGTDIYTIMKQVARWYDVEVEYKTTIKEKFHVEMSRNTNVSNVFKILETTGGVHFKIEGRNIIVVN